MNIEKNENSIKSNHDKSKSNKENIIRLVNVTKTYKMGEVKIRALNGVSFTVKEGEFVVIAGASGAGKSTILNILGGMDTPTSGNVFVDSRDVSKFSRKDLTTYRRYTVGFVFQFYNLIQNLTAIENLEMATQICKDPMDVDDIIDAVGLNDRKNNFPSQLSGGEQQRVAIARALAKNPRLLLCDEPTGALDYITGKQILKLLHDSSRKYGMTVIVITHNLAIVDMADRIIQVKNGKIEDERINENPKPIEEIEW